MMAAAPDGGTIGSGVGYMLDAGALTGGVGDSPGVCSGATSMGCQCGGLEPRGICSSAQARLIATCATGLPQHYQEVVVIQCHHTAAEDVGVWVRW
jgi:hypothetical protein